MDNPGIINGDLSDYQPPQPSGNLWDSIGNGFELNHYSDRPEVQAQIKWFMNHQEYLQRVATRATPYAYYILEQVKQRNIPTEIALLPIIESAYNPFMYSSVGAAGLWQFMPGTASGFKLRQDWWYDGRRDIYASTNAALDYLLYLHQYFNGDWLLALAAYNSGEGTVSNAIKRNTKKGLKTDFWDLKLPPQTRAYVPKLLALATIVAEPDTYPVNLPAIPDTPYLAVVTVGSQINLNNAAKYAGITIEDLYALNPGYKKWATDPNGPHKLILPVESVKSFKANMAADKTAKHITWTRYRVKAGDSLNRIAQIHHTSIELIKRLNQVKTQVLQVGQALLIPIGSKTLPVNIVNSVQHYLNDDTKVPGPSRKVYIVKSGDTLERIAARNKVNIYQLAYWNQLKPDSVLQIGDEIIIWSKKPRRSGRNYASQVRPYLVQHVVVTGDNLRDIADKYHVSVSELRKSNKLKGDMIRVGQTLIVPPTVRRVGSSTSKKSRKISYKVRSGDSINKIARHYGVSTSKLKQWNNIGSNNVIRVGEKLVIYN